MKSHVKTALIAITFLTMLFFSLSVTSSAAQTIPIIPKPAAYTTGSSGNFIVTSLRSCRYLLRFGIIEKPHSWYCTILGLNETDVTIKKELGVELITDRA
jgi:hypothetical protein